MPKYNIASGLPDLPVGLNDKDAALVGSLYRAVNSLAQQLSILTGSVQYTNSEQSQIDQFGGLTDSRQQKVYVKALEALAYGSLLTITVDGGKLAASLATATDLTKPAHAICDVPGGIAIGSYGVALFMSGRTAAVAGTAIGATYYLSTAGAMQITAPTADGVLNQVVAVGLGSAGIYLNIEQTGKRVCQVYKTTATNMRVQYTDGSFTDWTV
jgi:hypothetical protein